ncbi:S8 family serine peptidase [Ruegeria atlantica]|uniref:S8 family serine peptidase n=1 Tax=Ruegeria atlantica TaxID=81569 RepID=A0AA91BYU9_9RHOB|nr:MULTISPECIES: S8 family serine peptidase [Ruegeria]NOC81872.1 S8 family serine peptidase [Ruegeria sp. HKCCD6428]NOE17649.1 S8 family serine peptidase [Ruegeria atlantica]
MSELSREHVDRFERAERREIEKLRAEFGSESISKMDSIILRDLLANRKEARLNALLGQTETAQLPRHRVLVSLRSGRASPDRPPRAFDRRQRRRSIMQHRRHGEDVVGKIAKSFEERGIEVERLFWLTHSLVVLADDQRLTDIAGRADVLKMAHCKNQILIDLDNSRPLINADVVEASGINGAEVDVAVLDTGVDQTHPELAGNFGTQQDFTGEGLGDLNGHGTHCAGVVASNGATFRGVATGAVIHDYKLLDQFGSGNAPNCVAAIQQAVADGMDVLSNSWGFSHRNGNWVDPDGTCVLCVAADAASTAGVTFVVAAGNEGNDSCGTYDTRIRCPGIAQSVITVGASDDSDNMAGFSSPGPTPDGRDKPDVTAPGVDIVASRSATGNDMNGGATVIDPLHLEASGTSMACPHVAGVAALMLQRNPTLLPADIKAVLMATAVDIGAPTTQQGAGRVDARAAVGSV